MDEYLVGGAVRDALLGLQPRERDWVVVGSSPEAMSARGFRPVGKDFPVFLDPANGEEYALARRERKSGHGYGGFVFHTGSDVTLEEDLSRRDLTINAMARAADGTLIDPHGGQRDLAARVLRHVSPAFIEDPLRVLRVARFTARLHKLGFTVAPETLALMRELVASGELAHLAQERVWTEFERALGEDDPQEFVRVLRACGALAALLPEVDRLWGVPQPPKHHPEVDTGEHQLLALRMGARMGISVAARFALLLHDVGKGLTPPAEWPRHIAHEARGEPVVRAICERLRAPRRMRELAVMVCRQHARAHRAVEMRADTLVRLLDDLDAWRQPQRLEEFLDACEADARGRAGFEERPYDSGERVRRAFAAARGIDARAALERGLSGPAVGVEIHRQRCAAVRAAFAESTRDDA